MTLKYIQLVALKVYLNGNSLEMLHALKINKPDQIYFYKHKIKRKNNSFNKKKFKKFKKMIKSKKKNNKINNSDKPKLVV